ncbi:hypothetical protein [Consotaella salsifontis]|uniref:Phage regulatory protein Rha (Phage_pRha) n=1 Tax=Consotaella salsifontis TaxID=1365950 RepID=A0A1T4SRU0_9HYPH|nr:hypothetical protein [Consotaella salsifontis]SKA30866.1 hypothetical protein SAMN05428963_11377 [Consotaella salsifontis]
MTTNADVTVSSISIADINAGIDAEPRVSHHKLAAAIGMGRQQELLRLIQRNETELMRYGEVCVTATQTSERGGRPGKVYWLNEGQAVLIVIRSDAPRAPDVRFELITVFMDYRRAKADGKTVAVREHQRRASTKIDKAISLAKTATRLELVADRLDADGTDAALADEPLRAAGDDTPVTLGNLLDMLREANRRMHGGKATSTRYEINLIETVSESIAASCAPAQATRPNKAPYRDLVLTGINDGLSNREIVRRTGASASTVSYWRRAVEDGVA